MKRGRERAAAGPENAPTPRLFGTGREAEPVAIERTAMSMTSISRPKTITRTNLALVMLFLASGCTTPGSVWTIGSRTPSAPVGASDALRASIANTPQPDVAKHVRKTTFTTKELIPC